MKSKGFLQEFSDLYLKDFLDDWLKESSLRSLWRTFVVYIGLVILIGVIIMFFPLSNTLSKTNNGAFIYRAFMSFFVLCGLFLWFITTFSYYKFTIGKGNPIEFASILFFYVVSTVLFGFVYYFLFYASPNLFNYDELHIYWSPVVGERTIDNWANKLYFILYSAMVSVGGNFVYVESNSVLVSITNYAQTLYSFSLVSLLIAGYINQKTNKSA